MKHKKWAFAFASTLLICTVSAKKMTYKICCDNERMPGVARVSVTRDMSKILHPNPKTFLTDLKNWRADMQKICQKKFQGWLVNPNDPLSCKKPAPKK